MRIRPLLLLALTLAAGCRNSCQQLCNDMANFAKDNCGKEFSSDEVSQCISDHSKEDADAREACSTAAPGLDSTEEWNCDDIQEYFN